MSYSIDIIHKNMLKRYLTQLCLSMSAKINRQYIIDVVPKTYRKHNFHARHSDAHSHGLDCLYIEIACQKNANSTRFLKVICKKKHTMRIRKMSFTK